MPVVGGGLDEHLALAVQRRQHVAAVERARAARRTVVMARRRSADGAQQLVDPLAGPGAEMATEPAVIGRQLGGAARRRGRPC